MPKVISGTAVIVSAPKNATRRVRSEVCEDAAGLRASSWAKPVTWRRRHFAFWGVVPTISAAAMMRRDYAWRSKETRRCRRPDEGVGIEPWNLQQTNSLPVCPGHTNRLPKKSLQRFPIPKPPVGCGRMPACLSPLVFEIGDRCRRGSDPEQPKDTDDIGESLAKSGHRTACAEPAATVGLFYARESKPIAWVLR